jgi:hypothetical protein
MTATEHSFQVNQTEHNLQLGTISAPPAKSRPSDGPFSATELSVIGHLLGRRESSESVAGALGLDVQDTAELCRSLHRRSMLGMREVAGTCLYYVC